jgi:large repetitive protein
MTLPRLQLSSLVAMVCALTAVGFVPSTAAAQDITMVKDAPGSVLYGDQSQVTLRVSNPDGQPKGYNLTIRDVLPAGVSYVADPLAPIAPTIVPDEPEAGETTLIFDNVSDLSENSNFELTYRVSHDTDVFSIGDSYTNDAFAYISDDARFEPEINPDGTPGDEHIDGSASASATTLISAIEIVKGELSSEGEIMRGVHKHKTVYTLTVNNNSEGPTDAIRIEDWLPAGLEFLGCADADNTTDAPTNPIPGPEEYPGSGSLTADAAPAHPQCVVPDSVETVSTDPDGAGPMPTGIYTHVVWDDVVDLEVDGQTVVQYVAGIPLRENTMAWSGGLPPATNGPQGSNLDNNSGAETVDEQHLRNYAKATGTFDGADATDDDILLRYAEDLAVHKGVSTDIIVQGEVSHWTLRLRTSEYRYTRDIVVTDTLPDGLCPLGDQNFENEIDRQAECNDNGVDYPSPDYTTATEGADGRYTLVWDDSSVTELAAMQPSSEFTITFPTKTRTHYQEEFLQDTGEPVLAEDSWTNDVAVSGSASRICAPSDPPCDNLGTTSEVIDGDAPNPRTVTDVSSASQHAESIHIDKKVLERAPTFVDCDTGSYVDGPVSGYSPGDTVCWQLRIDFPGQLDTGQPTVTDFLPPGVSYVPGSAYETGADTVDATIDETQAASGVLTWNLPGDVPPGDRIFEWRFETTVGQAVANLPGEIEGNLMKVSFENTPGESFPLRDSADIERSQALLGLVKGVDHVNAGAVNPPNTDGVDVAAGDVVTFRIDVSNTGDLAASNAVVWDDLQDGITCDDVEPTSISDGGLCSDGRIVWSGLGVAVAGTHTLTYEVEIPAGVEPARTFNDHAGVVSYESATNTGTPFEYVPTDNIDTGATGANAPAADDVSHVQTRDVTMAKTRETSVTELPGNDLATEATIGEEIDYTTTIVVPEGTTLYGTPTFTDVLGARQVLVTPPAVSVTRNGSPVDPADFTLDTTGNTVSVEFLSPIVSPADGEDDTFRIAFTAQVADVAANHRGGTALRNTADFAWETQAGAAQAKSAHVDTTIVEPNVAVTKAEDDADGVVEPGDEVHYTVTARNTAGTHVSSAHDVQVVDDVPDGMTPSDISSGGSFDGDTITWTIASIAPGANVPLTYTATVDEPATAGEVFTNTVDLTATSLAGNATGERTAASATNTGYVADAEATVTLGEATLTKSVLPTSATIGEQVTYTAEATFPANVNYFDATLIDTLPDGLVFDDVVSVACVPNPCAPAVETLAPEPQPDGTTDVAWYLGDLPSLGSDRTYTVTYRAHVAVAYAGATPVQSGNTLVNAARAFYNGSDEIGTPTEIPDPGAFSDSSNPADADLGVVEPAVTIDKGVSGDANDDDVRDTQPGDDYTYSLVVRNGGNAPAYDIDVTDTPDETRLRNITPVANPAATIVDGDADVDGTLAWNIPGPIEPNESVTLTYTADLAPSASLSNGDTVVNVADVDTYWGVPAAVHAGDPSRYREYTDVPDDTVTLDVHLPELAVTKTTGAPTFPNSAVAQVGEAFDWRVVVRNDSTYAVADTVDVRDVLPANWDYVAGSASFAPGGAVEPTIVEAATGDTLTWLDVADLGPGEEIVLTFRARPTLAAATDPGSGASSPNVNAAEASAVDASGAGASADGDYDAGDDADAILELPELSVTKTPDGETVHAGAAATYTIVVGNDGDVPARDVVVTDVLGVGQTYAPGAASADPSTGFAESSATGGSGDPTTIEWEIAEIPAHGSVEITLPIGTDSSLPSGTDLVNDASVVSREITTPVDDGGSLETDVNADVGIDKQPQAAAVDAGEEMDFTLHVYNDGPSDATGVTVQDILSSNLSFVSATGASCGEAAGTVTCDIGDLAVDDSVDITLRVTVSPDETTGVSNTATVSSDDDSNPGNDSSIADKPVGVASNVVVEKTAPTEPILQGTSFDYVIQVSNEGISAAADVTLSDPLPSGVAFDGVVTDTGTCDEDSGTIDCSFGTLEPDQVAEVTVTVLAQGVGSPVNIATGATTSPETDDDDNEDSAQVTILPTADLAVTKSAPATVDAGGQLSYLLEVVNNGASDATGVTLTDTLPPGVEFVSADTGCDETDGIVTCAVGDLPVSESRDYDITVHVPYALADQDITNTVVVSGDEDDLNPDNDDDDATTAVGPAANVVVEKTAPVEPILQGTSFDYAIRVSNEGISAADDVTLSDPLPAGVVFDEVATDIGTCDEDAGTVECSFGTLAPDQVAEVTVTVFAQDVGDPVNTATGATTTNETDPDDNEDSAPVTIVPTADLAVTKSAPTTVAAGGELSYLLQVINNGSSDASGVTLTDTLPVGVEFVSADAECAEAAGIVTCDVGDLPVTESRDYTVTVRVPYALADQEVTNAVIVGGNEGDLFPDNDSDQATTTVGPAADLSISKTSNGATAGSTAGWTLVVANHGPSTAEPVTVVDTLPVGTTLRSASPGQGTCGAAGSVVTCDLGAIASDGSTQISIVADVPAGTAGQQLVNRATVTAPQPDPDPSNNTGEVTTPIGQPAATGPNLTMSKTASTSQPKLGKSYSYRLVVTNTGDAPAEEVHVVDTMSKALEIDKVTASKGTCAEQGTTVECDLGTLAAGEEERIRLVVTPTGTGRIRNVASANSRGGPSVDADGNTNGQADLDPSNNDDTANVRVTAPAASWALRKRASRSAVRGGEIVRFRIAVRVRQRAVADARVCDRLPAGLVFVRAPGARFRDGRACWTMRYLAPGARRTLRIVTRAERGFSVRRVRNVAVARARNATRRAAAARVRIDPAFGGDGGGVTG